MNTNIKKGDREKEKEQEKEKEEEKKKRRKKKKEKRKKKKERKSTNFQLAESGRFSDSITISKKRGNIYHW